MAKEMIEGFAASRDGVKVTYDAASQSLSLQADYLDPSETLALSNLVRLQPGAYRLTCSASPTCEKFGVGLMKGDGSVWANITTSWSVGHELLSEIFVVAEDDEYNVAVFSKDMGRRYADNISCDFADLNILPISISNLRAKQNQQTDSLLHTRNILRELEKAGIASQSGVSPADETLFTLENPNVKTFSQRLIMTFSNRPLDPARSNLHFLTTRWMTPGRLDNLPEFSSLPDLDEGHRSKGGRLVVFDLTYDGRAMKFKPIYEFSSDRKIQHGCFLNDNLVIAYEDGLEIFCQSEQDKWDRFVKSIDDPWFAGVHTVFPYEQKYLIVSASAPDGYVILDPESERVKKRWRMPKAVYGENYKLAATSDLKRNFIHNDCQIGHLNYAYPDAKGNVYVSICAQGDVGRVSRWGFYSQLITGTTGLHGARDVPGRDIIYFSDSAKGMLVLANKKGQVQRRFDAKSIWLHDSVLLSWPWFLLAKSDNMSVDLVDVESMTTIRSLDLGHYGFVQFFS